MSDKVETTIAYGDYTVDVAKLPQASVMALLRRGFSHFMGSEQASKVTGRFTPNDKGALPEGVTDTPEARTAYKSEVQTAAFAALQAGTVGQHVSRGPKVDPITATKQAIARREVTETLKANGLKFPKGDETVDLGGTKLSGADLISRRLAKHGDRIHKEAVKHVNDLERAKKKAAEQAKARGDAPVSVEALDL